ncbi:MAG TPA: hypothetical protein ENK18_23690 [Deltaproteobacteria bacterium]|nr:hypothetical protein [Deltaproteobacteria bacterium]
MSLFQLVARCLACLLLLSTSARAQVFLDQGEVLAPDPGVLWASESIGAPAVTYDSIRDRFLMVFESRTPFTDASCPQGIWTLGLATSPDGTTWTIIPTPLLQPSPGSGTFYSCVAAHPAAVFSPTGNGRMQVVFKAEQDTVGCGAGPCPYTGIGRLRVLFDAQGDVSTVNVQATPILPLTTAGGFPSIASDGSSYYMIYQSYPNVYFSQSGSFLSFPAGTLAFDVAAFGGAPGTADTAAAGPQWVYDEFFSPSLICDDSVPFPWAVWVGSRDTNFGAVINGAWGKGIRTAAVADWLLATTPTKTWANDDDWRHWDMLRLITGDYLMWYSKKDALGNNSIYFGGTTLTFNNSDVQSRACP